jgi:hypothetical protein
MSEVYISPAIFQLPNLTKEAFGDAQDDIAQKIAGNWKGRIIELDVIDTHTYLSAVAVQDEVQESGDMRTVMIEAPEAAGYASAIKRGHDGDYDYVGQRVAEEGIKTSDGEIKSALDRAGDRVKG